MPEVPDAVSSDPDQRFMDSLMAANMLCIDRGNGPEYLGVLYIHGSLNCWLMETDYFLKPLMIDAEHNFHQWDEEKAEYVQIPSPLHDLRSRISSLRALIDRIELQDSAPRVMEPQIWPLILVKSRLQVAAPKGFDLDRFVTRLSAIDKMADDYAKHVAGAVPLAMGRHELMEDFVGQLVLLGLEVPDPQPPIEIPGGHLRISLSTAGFEPVDTKPDADEDA